MESSRTLESFLAPIFHCVRVFCPTEKKENQKNPSGRNAGGGDAWSTLGLRDYLHEREREKSARGPSRCLNRASLLCTYTALLLLTINARPCASVCVCANYSDFSRWIRVKRKTSSVSRRLQTRCSEGSQTSQSPIHGFSETSIIHRFGGGGGGGLAL